ncbi:FdtA/QdtA family cupin domain-containing protein [uncultured Formosa sp.]|uniref:sugar 3,4-ketoisomerase n=1 Tax=uncultured Formosa sp. TaxID=255435 RepID=UPI00263834F6|nr:FdtA/QdtA family cupin domain-containing protein [uncultured Formosa sp.]
METTTTQNITSRVNDLQRIEIPKIKDIRGNLAVIEKDCIPFEIKRVYFLYDVPSDASRGGHAHKTLYQFLIPVSGSFEVRVKDGEGERVITMNKPDIGLLIVPGIWREIENFSSGSVCLVLASAEFNENDYIRDYEDYLSFKGR